MCSVKSIKREREKPSSYFKQFNFIQLLKLVVERRDFYSGIETCQKRVSKSVERTQKKVLPMES